MLTLWFIRVANCGRRHTFSCPAKVNGDKHDVWQVVLKINNNNVNCQLDTGAQVNIVSIDTFKRMVINVNDIKNNFV